MNISKEDWKLFQRKLPLWQEKYMERLTEEYIRILSGSEQASERFWKLADEMKKDCKHPGVLLELNKNTMVSDLIALICDNVISMDDLADFSAELQENIKNYIFWGFRRQ